MSRWFRVYDDMINEPKVQKLAPDRFKILINLWCVASKKGGTLPCAEDIAFQLRLGDSDIDDVLTDFIERGLIDRNRDGTLTPHNWNTRQYKSDISSSRVTKHRQKHKRNADETEV